MTFEDVRKMTDDELKIRVAKICNTYRVILQCMKCESLFNGEPGKKYEHGVFCPVCMEAGYTLVGICHPIDTAFPNYTGSLDAMHEAESIFVDNTMDSLDLGWQYATNLEKLFPDGEKHRKWHATARQRAEAFILTMEQAKEEVNHE